MIKYPLDNPTITTGGGTVPHYCFSKGCCRGITIASSTHRTLQRYEEITALKFVA